jgi:hypothetical protein
MSETIEPRALTESGTRCSFPPDPDDRARRQQ